MRIGIIKNVYFWFFIFVVIWELFLVNVEENFV